MPNIRCPHRRSILRGLTHGPIGLLLSAVPALAQTQLWGEQIGTSGQDRTLAAAPDGVGGVYFGGLTQGSLGGSHVGSDDAWLARYAVDGTQVWIRQIGTIQYDAILGAVPCTSGGTYVVGHTKGNLVG